MAATVGVKTYKIFTNLLYKFNTLDTIICFAHFSTSPSAKKKMPILELTSIAMETVRQNETSWVLRQTGRTMLYIEL